MSNRTYLVQCVFIDEPDGDRTYGYRLFDDYEKIYDNSLTEEEYKKLTSESLLEHALTHYPDFDLAPPKGIYVNDDYFLYDIKTKKYVLED